MNGYRNISILLGFFLYNDVTLATERYDITISMPVIQPGNPVELSQLSFNTYYSPLETRVSIVSWDPCNSVGQNADCKLINPVKQANISVELYAFNAESINSNQGCYVSIDLTRYRALPPEINAALGNDNPRAKLIQLAVKSIQLNTAGYDDYSDCEIRLKGHEQHPELSSIELPRYLQPVISECLPYSKQNHKQARISNDTGMDYYRSGDWKKAETAFLKAAKQDCDYFIARTNLASVLARQKQFEKARAVLWRAYKMNPDKTLEKLASDSDYQQLKHNVNFYSAASPIGLAYHHYCLAPKAPAELDPELPNLMARSGLKKYGKPYTIATKYIFEADFNNNGTSDTVYPLIVSRLSSAFVVFDNNQINPEGCTSTPIHSRESWQISKGDPCKYNLFAGAQGSSRGIRIESDQGGISSVVCK